MNIYHEYHHKRKLIKSKQKKMKLIIIEKLSSKILNEKKNSN